MLILKQLRINAGKKQGEISEMLGISRAAYANLENGKRDPDTATLVTLADYYKVSMDMLFGRTEQSVTVDKYTREEIDLVSDFRLLNRQGQEYIRQTMQMALAAYAGEDADLPILASAR